jgi:hypothetical protein
MLSAQWGMAQNAAISKFINRYDGRDGYTIVYITSKMFSMLADIPDEEDEESMMNTIKKLTGVSILSTEDNPEAPGLFKEAYSLLPRNQFEDLMVVKEGDEETKFMVHQEGDVISELVMISGGEDTFTLISLTGDLRLKDISRISRSLDIRGFDKLEKVDEQH